MTAFAYSPPRQLDMAALTPPDDAGADAIERFADARTVLLKGDCLKWLDALPANHFDAVITDPPYHFQTIVDRFGADDAAECQHGTDGAFKRASAGFMGKKWDGGDVAFRTETWAKVLRVLKPGGHIAAFSAPKCVHKMAIAIEAAGFEVRDRVLNLRDPDPALIAFLDSLTPAQADALFRLTDMFGGLGEAFWCFGTGFPKSHDVSKAIDKLLGAEPEKVPAGAPVKRMIPGADQHKEGWEKTNGRVYQPGETIPATEAALAWDGWGTALKPAYEPIVIARKPMEEASVARQVLATGTGGINIGATAIETDESTRRRNNKTIGGNGVYQGGAACETGGEDGRFPANLTHDGSEAATAGFPQTSSGELLPHHKKSGNGLSGTGTFAIRNRTGEGTSVFGDTGSAARFFYSGKAGDDDRLGSGHPTVKPVDLMAWLCRMLCPKGGLILDPFAGTGSTAEAAFREGVSTVLIEAEPDYHADIARRMGLVLAGPAARKRAANAAKAKRRSETPAETSDDGPLDIFHMPETPPDRVRAGKSTASSPTKREGAGHD